MLKIKRKTEAERDAEIDRIALQARHLADGVLFLVPSSKGFPYLVNFDTGTCECPYFKYYSHCKHLKALARISRLAKQWGYL